MSSAALIVGIGNTFRGDDGVGPWVAEALAARGLRATVHAGDGTGILDLLAAETALILIDATNSGAEPGALTFHYSTHRFGLAEAVETARALDQMPKALQIYGIEGADFAAGEGLSAAVEAAAGDLVDRISGVGTEARVQP